MNAAATTVVVADTSVLINMIHIQRLDLLGELEPLTFVAPDQVVAEVRRAEEAAALADAIRQGHVSQRSSTEPGELALYVTLRQILGKGEAAALAMAQTGGHMIACDERGRFLREVRERLGDDRLMNTPGIMLRAIRRGRLSLAEADQLKSVLEVRRFKMRFESFNELL